jgi:ABC-type bacteriocin/lantibiotic exporter with double-glycine peptidase domain
LLDWLQRWYLLRFQTKLVLLMATRFFWHLLKLPLTFFTQRAPGEVAWRLMLNDNIANVITGELARTRGQCPARRVLLHRHARL